MLRLTPPARPPTRTLISRKQELDARTEAVERQAAEFTPKKKPPWPARWLDLKDVGARRLRRSGRVWPKPAPRANRTRPILTRSTRKSPPTFDTLRAQAPELDDQAKLALERLPDGPRSTPRAPHRARTSLPAPAARDLEAARAADSRRSRKAPRATRKRSTVQRTNTGWQLRHSGSNSSSGRAQSRKSARQLASRRNAPSTRRPWPQPKPRPPPPTRRANWWRKPTASAASARS